MADRAALPLAGRTAVVTGGGQGMGRAIALAFAAEGADVAVIDRRPDGLEELCAQLRAEGRRAFATTADITDVGGLEGVFGEVVEALGGFEILMNNAGVCPEGPAIDATEADWDLAFDVNAKALFFCAQQAGRHFRAAGKRGKIVNTCSTYGQTVEEGLGVYCASKGAVLQITRALAAEWARHGINVNAVGPTLVDTAMTAELFADGDYLERFLARIPAGRLPRPSDVADAVMFLAGPRSDHVHGHMLLVDGGESAV